MTVESADGPLWKRQLLSPLHRTKTDYTAQIPSLLAEVEEDPIHLDTVWLEENYTAIPYACNYCVIRGPLGRIQGIYCSAAFIAGTEDTAPHFEFEYSYIPRDTLADMIYVIEDHFDEALLITTESGAEFILTAKDEMVWAESRTDHFNFSLTGYYVTVEEVIEILDSLDLTVQWEP